MKTPVVPTGVLKNGRLWAYKQEGKTILSNKNFDDVSTANSMNFTVCQVKNDVISFHTQLQILLSQAQTIHQDFVDINTAYPALNILSQTCFLGKSFKDLMKLTLIEHKNCIYELDKSLVSHLNTLLENEKSHDKDIRVVYQLLKSLGYYFDLIHNRAISFNLRTHQGHSISHELTSLDKELREGFKTKKVPR